MAKSNVVELAREGEDLTPEMSKEIRKQLKLGEQQQKTDKSYLKKAEKIVRKLDNIVSDLNDLTSDAQDLEESIITTEVSRRDADRFNEMAVILEAATNQLYHMAARMSRKYVGKEIDELRSKRKALKKN